MTGWTDRLLEAYLTHRRDPALRVDSGWLTFEQLADRVAASAQALLSLGVEPGDRVVVAAESRPELVIADQAIWFAGAVRVALGGRVHGRELARVVADCRPRLVVCEQVHRDQGGSFLTAALTGAATLQVLDGAADRLPSWLTGTTPHGTAVLAAATAVADDNDQAAALMYTSGTTGEPRGAVATHRSWAAMTDGIRSQLPGVGVGDTFGHLAPMSHLGGSVGHALLLNGAAAIVPPVAARRSLSVFAQEGITVTAVVPALLRRLLEGGTGDISAAEPVSGVHAVVHGGSAAAPDLVVQARRIFGDVVHQVYGTSEAMIPLTWLSPTQLRAAGEPALRSAGVRTGVGELEVRDTAGMDLPAGVPGDIVVRGPTVSPGYGGSDGRLIPVAGADGWYRTGDVGYVDEQGLLFLLDRSKELIVSGGFSISPNEVEAVIAELPEVAECVVCAVPDTRWGEGVGAVVRLRPGAALDAAAVIAVCRTRLAGYKKPSLVRFVDAFPDGPTGKTDRAAVRAAFWAGSPRLIGVE